MITTYLAVPVLGLVFALLFWLFFDTGWISVASPRINALLRIVFGLMWMFAGLFVAIVLCVVMFVNWLIFQLILGRKDWKGIAEPVIDWWIDWTKTIIYGYP